MKRKTNLFYSTGIDSNFLTFSNYTESLTGNILVTNSKMFPSKFICLYIPTLDEKIINQEVEENIDNNLILESFEERKADFIKRILVGYYENKLAILRDNLSIEDIVTIYSTSKAAGVRARQIGRLLKNNCGEEINLGDISIY